MKVRVHMCVRKRTTYREEESMCQCYLSIVLLSICRSICKLEVNSHLEQHPETVRSTGKRPTVGRLALFNRHLNIRYEINEVKV